MKIAIIGAGTAGVSVLRELVKYQEFKDLEVDIYDNPENMGQGVPFQNDSQELLINLPSDQMSLNLDNPREFYEWYERQDDFKFEHPEFLPRFIFGHYMKSYLEQYQQTYDNINVIYKEVTEVYIDSNIGDTEINYHVCTSNDMSECKVYDVVFLAIGTLSYHDPYHLKGTKGYIQTPYPTYNTLDEVDDTDRIAIVGTGLASLDVIRYVTAHHPNLPITVTSRSGHLPSVRGEMPDIEFEYITPEHFNRIKKDYFGNVPLQHTIDLFVKECERFDLDLDELVHRKQGEPIHDLTYDLDHPKEVGIFQTLLEMVKENMNWIWNSFSHQDQEKFLKEYHGILKANSNPMPPTTAHLIIDGIHDGLIEIKKNVKDIYYDEPNSRFCIYYEEENEKPYIFDIVINATGAKTHLADLDHDDQLVINLENRQVVQSHSLGGIQIIPETNQVISPRYGTLRRMYAFGQLTNGINQSRNGVNMIVKQAASVVDQMFENMREH